MKDSADPRVSDGREQEINKPSQSMMRLYLSPEKSEHKENKSSLQIKIRDLPEASAGRRAEDDSTRRQEFIVIL